MDRTTATDSGKSALDRLEQHKYAKTKRHFLQVWTLVGVAALVVVVTYLLNILSMPVGIIIWTVVICFILAGPVNWFERHGMSRGVATFVAYVIMFVVLGLLFVIMFMPPYGITSQFAQMISTIPDFVRSLTSAVNDIYARYADVLQNEQVKDLLDDVMSSLYTGTSGLASASANGIVLAGTSLVSSLGAIGFALVVAFWMLLELPNVAKEFKRLMGSGNKRDLAMLYATVTRVMGGYIKGTLIQCAVIGVGCGILFAIIGAPNAAALGVITGVLNIIPVVGPWLGGLVAALSCLFVSPFAVFIALVGTIVIQQAVYMLVSPKVMGNAVDIHPALTFIALVAGGAIGSAMSGTAGSLIGALLSIPAVAVMKSVFVYYFEERIGRKIVSPDGVFFKENNPTGVLDPMADATGYSYSELKNMQEAAEPAEGESDRAAAENHNDK